MSDRMVFAYSGGASSSEALARHAGREGAEVVAVVVDIGQGRELEGIRERALAAGAIRCHVLDLEAAFAKELVWPAVCAGADPDLPHATVAAPLFAQALLELARVERAAEVAHGARGPAARQLEASLRSLDPAVRVHPGDGDVRVNRSAVIDDLEARGRSGADAPLRVERSLWGRRVTGTSLSDPWVEPPNGVFSLTRAPEACPDQRAGLEIAFERGTPVAVNGVSLPLVELLRSLDTIAGVHGVGRFDLAALDDDGRLCREAREAPALTTLRLAHRALERLATTHEEAAMRRQAGDQYTALLRAGLWHAPGRRALDASIEAVQSRVSGVVRLTLFKGHARVVGRRAEGYDRPAVARSSETLARGPA